MKIYVSHASSFDFTEELYTPIKEALSIEYEVILPHEVHMDGVYAKDIIASCDVVIAETSYPSTGQGIELGWADERSVPVICIFKSTKKPSSALQFISNRLLPYDSSEDMVEKIKSEVDKLTV